LAGGAGAYFDVFAHEVVEHFPGGKTELVVAAIQAGVASVTRGLDRLIEEHGEPIGVLRAWFAGAQHRLEKSGFELTSCYGYMPSRMLGMGDPQRHLPLPRARPAGSSHRRRWRGGAKRLKRVESVIAAVVVASDISCSPTPVGESTARCAGRWRSLNPAPAARPTGASAPFAVRLGFRFAFYI
jgi:hypothetical protein